MDEKPKTANSLGDVIAAVNKAATSAGGGDAQQIRQLPPVHLWEPDYCGDIGLKIARDGQWSYAGSPIGRVKLVELFSTILRRDPDDEYYLVTPAEKIRVEVEDVPFIAVGMEVEGSGPNQKLTFRTNVGDIAMADAEHPLRFEIDPQTQEPSPYIHIRARLDARINRAVYYELVELGCEHEGYFGIWSGGVFAPIMSAEGLA
jgi:hypothetical protein